ncbi:DUF3108 domain-containing protein [uncultured Ramlibacter sp.]|uniref:DUF3108 domain-containing protein n=1 Tax=uncultured Ramlibacter sp. TaxID=260755 RepID=UPI0026352762|nr:DUF3108 domain-containing protein [uncultured Ramlibacter sp.]
MARRARLNAGSAPAGLALRLLAIGLAVLLAHGLALDWLARQLPAASVLRSQAEPMFTRLLQPQTPPAPPASEKKRPAAPVKQASPATESIAISSPAATATAAVTDAAPPPEPVAPQPPEAAAAESLPEAATAAVTATADPADSWPADTRLNYQLGGRFRSGELYGDAKVQWQRDGNRYQARIDIDVTLMVRLLITSQGEVRSDGLLPLAYEEVRRGKSRGMRMDEASIFFADGRRAPRPGGMQDTASQFVELAHRFATGQERLEVGRSVDLWLARPNAVDLWTYDIVEREMLRTPRLGEIEAFRLKPRPIANPRGNITAEMWFAPSLQYLPVRIRVSMGEEAVVDLIVDSIEQR